MKKKILSLFMVLILVVTMLAGCSSSSASKGSSDDTAAKEAPEEEKSNTAEDSGEVVTLQFWDMDWNSSAGTAYVDSARAVVDEFNASQDKIFVEYQSVAWQDYYQYYLTAVQGGAAPDVFTGGSQTPIQFYTMGEILPLDDIVEAWKADGTYEKYAAGSLESNYYDGHYISIAWAFDVRSILYNTELFEGAGVDGESIDTWDKFLDACAKLKAAYPDKVIIADSGQDSKAQQTTDYFRITNAAGQTDAEGLTATFNSDGMRETFEFLAELSDNGYFAEGVLGHDDAAAQSLFLTGDACMLMHGGVAQSSDPAISDKVGMLPAIQGPSADSPGVLYWANSIGAFAQTEHPEEAKTFIKWWCENQEPVFEGGQLASVPARTDFASNEYFTSNWHTSQVVEKLVPYLRHATYPVSGFFPAYGLINGERYMAEAMQKIHSGDRDIDAILEHGQAQVEAAIASANEG